MATCWTRGLLRSSTTGPKSGGTSWLHATRTRAWQANPGFRADRGSRWRSTATGRRETRRTRDDGAGVDSNSAVTGCRPGLMGLCRTSTLRRAYCWGVAMRLGQRRLRRRRLGPRAQHPDVCRRHRPVTVRRGEEALIGDRVERRFARLAEDAPPGAGRHDYVTSVSPREWFGDVLSRLARLQPSA